MMHACTQPLPIALVPMCAGTTSETEALVLEALTTSSTPITRSPSKALSRQASRAGLTSSHNAVGQVSQ